MTDFCRREFTMLIVGGNLFPINMALTNASQNSMKTIILKHFEKTL